MQFIFFLFSLVFFVARWPFSFFTIVFSYSWIHLIWCSFLWAHAHSNHIISDWTESSLKKQKQHNKHCSRSVKFQSKCTFHKSETLKKWLHSKHTRTKMNVYDTNRAAGDAYFACMPLILTRNHQRQLFVCVLFVLFLCYTLTWSTKSGYFIRWRNLKFKSLPIAIGPCNVVKDQNNNKQKHWQRNTNKIKSQFVRSAEN